MSVQWAVPKESRYINTSTVFRAQWNVPTAGRYDFGTLNNANQPILVLQPNTVYLLERITVAGDVAGEDFTAALDLTAQAPTLELRRLLDGSSVYETVFVILSYIPQRECAVWVRSDRLGDALTGTVSGVLMQTVPLVGRADVRLTVSFGIYAMESTVFNRAFRAGQGAALQRSVRGG